MKIQFSPPDIREEDIEEVIKVLKSGWITSGPVTKQFETDLSKYTESSGALCLNSATAGLEMALRFMGIEEGDEVITSAYTYTASASIIHHVGATIVLVDTVEGSTRMDLADLYSKISSKTKAIIPIDIAGIPENYKGIKKVIMDKRKEYKFNNVTQKKLGRILLVGDAAHSLGATYDDKKVGSICDFTCFSFHAVKNLTTAEGGAIVWNDEMGELYSNLYQELRISSLHGQTKDALQKSKAGAWEYDIIELGYKYNMTDIAASLGVSQLKRYQEILTTRERLFSLYKVRLDSSVFDVINHKSLDNTSSYHLLIVRIKGKNIKFRNKFVELMGENLVPCNVHYKPLPLFTAYRDLGFDIHDFPNALDFYSNCFTLPLHTKLTLKDVDFISLTALKVYSQLIKEKCQ